MRLAAGISLLLLALVAAPSCGGDAEPPSVEAPPPEPEPEPEEPEEEAPWEPPAGVDHTVAEGESLWLIARTYGVTVDQVVEANRLSPRQQRVLRVGQTLRIPGVEEAIDVAQAVAEAREEELPPLEDGAYHRLGDGETLWDVAHAYEVDVDALMTRNELDDEAVRRLRPGTVLIVPGATQRQVEQQIERREREQTSTGPFVHRVRPGENVWTLANAFGVTVGQILAANRLEDDAALREGTRLFIPGVTRDASGNVRRRLSRAQEAALRYGRRIGLGTRHAAHELLAGRIEPRWRRAASRGWRRGRVPGTLRWPIPRGWYVRGFGSGEGGYHLAVDIMGRIGWSVRASAPGIVGYSGNEIRGYGNMVIVIHPGGWITMYAHNSANLVVPGQRVPAGGILAEVGSTGISRGPHVHYEFIFDGQNCDPNPLFRPAILHRDGRRSRVRQVRWTRAAERPEEVECTRRRRHPNSRWVERESYDPSAGE
jgi:murein DD-endopeptidase MepM/ murein hydrolase activator NlpD